MASYSTISHASKSISCKTNHSISSDLATSLNSIIAYSQDRTPGLNCPSDIMEIRSSGCTGQF